MAKLEYYSVVVSDKAGRGEHVLSALKEAGVNFVGIWAYPVGKSKSRIDLVAEDTAQLKKAAKKLKIELGKKQTAFHITGEENQRLCDAGPLRRQRPLWRADSSGTRRHQEGGEGPGVRNGQAGRPVLP